MNEFEYIDEIKAPEAWKASAKELWTDAPAERRSALRLLRPLPLAAVIAVLLIGTAAAYFSGVFRNPIVVENAEEAHAAAEKIMESYDDDSEHGYSYSEPAPEQSPLSSCLEGATYTADHWLDEIYVDYQLLGVKKEQDWTFDGFDSSEGPLWKRHASTSDGWTKQQYVAETLVALNEADPAVISFNASMEDTGLSMIPFGNRLEVVKDENDALLGVNAKLCWLSEDERFFQMEYSYESNDIDWGLNYVTRDAFDDVVEFTTEDGWEFVITTYQDRLWAESTTPNETYSCYGIGISIEEAEAILDSINVTIQG